MDNSIILVCLLTFAIHYISMLSFTVRIVGIRTAKFAISYALINLLIIGTRLANTIQEPLLAKRIETNILLNRPTALSDFRIIIASASLGIILGALSIPTFQRFLGKAVESFYKNSSMIKFIFKGMGPKGFKHLKKSLTIPRADNIKLLFTSFKIPVHVFVLNILTYTLLTISVLSCLYAGSLNPEYRSTTTSMTGIVNGLAIIIALIVIDPYLAVLQDKVVGKEKTEGYFRRVTVEIIFARFLGTVLAQAVFVPVAQFISFIASNNWH